MNLRSRLEAAAPSTWPNLAWAVELDASCPPSFAPWRVASSGQYLVVANEVRLYVVTPDGYPFVSLAAIACFHGFALDGNDLYVVDGPVLLKYDLSSELQGQDDGPDLAVNLLAGAPYARDDRPWDVAVMQLYAHAPPIDFSPPLVRSGSDQLAVFVLSADGHLYARSTNLEQHESTTNGVVPDAMVARLQTVAGHEYFCYPAGGDVITIDVDQDVLRFDSSVALPNRERWSNATAWVRAMNANDAVQPWLRFTTYLGKTLVTQFGSMALLASGDTLTLADFGANGIPQLGWGGGTPTPAGTVRSSTVSLRPLSPPAPLPDAQPLLVADEGVMAAYVPVGGYTSTFELHKYQFPALTADAALTALWLRKTANEDSPGFGAMLTLSTFVSDYGPVLDDALTLAALAQQARSSGFTGDVVSAFARPLGSGTRQTAPPAIDVTFRADPNTTPLPFVYRLFVTALDAIVLGGPDGFWYVPLGGGTPVNVRPPPGSHFSQPVVVGSTLYCLTEWSLLAYALTAPGGAPVVVPAGSGATIAAVQPANGAVRLYLAAQDSQQQHWTVAAYDAGLNAVANYVSPAPGPPRSALVATVDPAGNACVVVFDPGDTYDRTYVELDATTLQPIDPPGYGTMAQWAPNLGALRIAAADQPWCFAIPDRVDGGMHAIARADAGGTGRIVIQHSDLIANTNALRVVTFTGAAPSFPVSGQLDRTATPATAATIAALPPLTYGGATMLTLCAAPYLEGGQSPQSVVLALVAHDRTVHVQRYALPAAVADTTWPGYWQAEFAGPPRPNAPVPDDDWNLYRIAASGLAAEQPTATYGVFHV